MDQIEYFLTHQISLSNWKIDSVSLNWFSYFLTHRALPQVTDNNPERMVDIFIQHYIFSKPQGIKIFLKLFSLFSQVTFPPQVNIGGIRVASKILENMKFNNIDSFNRFVLVLFILAGKSVGVSQEWIWSAISSQSLGVQLISRKFIFLYLLKNN